MVPDPGHQVILCHLFENIFHSFLAHARAPRPPITDRHLRGEGLRVFFADALGDGFELFGHGPHGVIVAARDHCRALDVATYQDFCCQQDQPCFDITAYETLHCLHPRMVFEGKPNVMTPFGGDFDLARLLVPTDQAELLQDGG